MKNLSSIKLLLIRLLIYAIITILIIAYIVLCSYGHGLPCVLYDKTGVMCHSCGATRALLAFLSLDFNTAIKFHSIFSLVLYPMLLLLFAQDLFVAVINAVKKSNKQSLLTFVFGKQVQEE